MGFQILGYTCVLADSIFSSIKAIPKLVSEQPLFHIYPQGHWFRRWESQQDGQQVIGQFVMSNLVIFNEGQTMS